MDEYVDTGANAVNEHGNTSENHADTIVIHSDLIGSFKTFKMIWCPETQM